MGKSLIKKVYNFIVAPFWKAFRKYPLIRKIISLIINILSIPLVAIMLFIRIFVKYKIIRLKTDRIGGFTIYTECYLRTHEEEMRNMKVIGIGSNKPANRQFLDMVKRVMYVIEIPDFLFELLDLFHTLTGYKNHLDNTILEKFNLYYSTPLDMSNEYYKWKDSEHTIWDLKPKLKFTKDEEKKGKKILKDMGVNDWFICLHSRDPAYFKKARGSDGYGYSYRDCDIKNFMLAAKHIAKQGGAVLRMGALVEKKMPITNSKLIDYAMNYRSDFGDAYLPAKCKFFLANSSGLATASVIFNVPVIYTNLPFLLTPPPGRKDLFILKKMWSKKKKRFLTVDEMINTEVFYYFQQQEFDKAGLVLIENTPQEILDVTKEMNERLDGTWKTTKEDEELQKKV